MCPKRSDCVPNLREGDGEGREVQGQDGGDGGLNARPGGERVDDRLIPEHHLHLKGMSNKPFLIYYLKAVLYNSKGRHYFLHNVGLRLEPPTVGTPRGGR